MLEAAQRKAEEKYRNFFENSVAGIFQTTLDGQFMAANPALAQMLGYDSPEELMASVTDLNHQLYAHAGNRVEFSRRLGEDGKVSGFETELYRKDGSTIWIVTNAIVIRDNEGQPLCFEGTLVDISARKRAEQEQEETRRKQEAWIGALEQRTRESSLLNQMSDLIQCCPTVDEAYSVIEQQARWIFQEESGVLYIVNSSRNLAESKAAWGTAFEDAPAFKPADCWGFRRAQLHIVEETGMKGNKDTGPVLYCRHLHSPAHDAYMCVPLIAQGETLGVLHLRHSAETSSSSVIAQGLWYTEARQQLAHMVADSLALAISNINLRESLRQQSIRDSLTGMFNRRYMEESLEREVARAARAGRPVAVIMIDIDHFKHFNDVSGHAAGDAVLRELGALLRSEVREADIACRYGGEEFTFIMPDASLEVALRRADKLREDVKRLNVRYGGRLLGPINISLGVAEFPTHGATGDAVLRMADVALYRAKQAGRDRAMVADI